MSENPKEILFPEIKAGGFSRIDGTIMFYSRVNALLAPEMKVVDFGAGRGAAGDDMVPYRRSLSLMRGKVREVIGVDIDDAVLHNEFVDRSVHIRENQSMPLQGETIDMIIADNVFEHIQDPNQLVSDFYRVLKPNGWVCARTTNRNSYVALAARMIPDRAHNDVLRRAQPNRKVEDIFPTAYKMNTVDELRRIFPKSEWDLIVFGHSAEPAYAGKSVISWRLFIFLHWLLAGYMATTLQIFVQKNASPSA